MSAGWVSCAHISGLSSGFWQRCFGCIAISGYACQVIPVKGELQQLQSWGDKGEDEFLCIWLTGSKCGGVWGGFRGYVSYYCIKLKSPLKNEKEHYFREMEIMRNYEVHERHSPLLHHALITSSSVSVDNERALVNPCSSSTEMHIRVYQKCKKGLSQIIQPEGCFLSSGYFCYFTFWQGGICFS